MIVCIGSTSKPKIIAICRAFARFPEIWMQTENASLKFVVMTKSNVTENGKDSVSEVSSHPVTLEETFKGARNRAIEAYKYAVKQYDKCAFSVGIEAGIFHVPETNTGYLDTSACVIYDGKSCYYGSSPMFEYPKKVVDRILNGEEAGLISDFFGNEAKGRGGVIGPLTNGRINRDEFEEYAVVMALTQVLRKDLYCR
jgi:inosine/xanthosine triphosphatase